MSFELQTIHSYIRGIVTELTTKTNITISDDTIKYVLRQLHTIFMKESMLIRTTCPIHIIGDLHGQFDDLLKIFDRCGNPSKENRYIFLGDYVDRGPKSIETFILIGCFKILYPDNVIMLRGNHESTDISREYGFLDECRRKYNVKLWKHFCDVFHSMSVAATIGPTKNKPLAFCAHGGISKYINSLKDIENIKKPTEVDNSKIITDLLWSDPSITNGWNESSRGVSYTFGVNQLYSFMKKIDVELVIRGHEVVEDGYEFFGNRKLVTVFSAPKYCGDFDNCGSVLKISDKFCCSFQIFE